MTPSRHHLPAAPLLAAIDRAARQHRTSLRGLLGPAGQKAYARARQTGAVRPPALVQLCGRIGADPADLYGRAWLDLAAAARQTALLSTPLPAAITRTPAVGGVEPYEPGLGVPLGWWRPERAWMARAACARPEHAAWRDTFTAEEDDREAIAIATAICQRCPVRLDCRLYAEETNEYGVYAGETYTQRTRKLRRRWSVA